MALRGAPVPQPTSRKLPPGRLIRSMRKRWAAMVKKVLMKRSQMQAGKRLNTDHIYKIQPELMKGELEPKEQQGKVEPRKGGESRPSLQSMTPNEIKSQMGRKIRDNELRKIRKMSLSEVNDVADKSIDPPFFDGSRTNKIRLLNMQMGVTADDVDSTLKSPGEKHLEMMEKAQKLAQKKRIEYKKDPVMATIKRGKLGIDNFFIFFGIFGSFLIPVYVFQHFRKNREAIINSRIAPPQVIKRLDEDSPIQLEEVNYHTIHYYNPDRVKESEVKQHIFEARQKLERDVYF